MSGQFVLQLNQPDDTLLLVKGEGDRTSNTPHILAQAAIPDTIDQVRSIIDGWRAAYGGLMCSKLEQDTFMNEEMYPYFDDEDVPDEDDPEFKYNPDGCALGQDLDEIIQDPCVPQGIVDYARYKQRAMWHREAGEIKEALKLEAICDAMHKALPKKLRW